ncbi:MAG: class I SAM-dependent methyltransferase [Nitrososphaerota archaeon]
MREMLRILSTENSMIRPVIQLLMLKRATRFTKKCLGTEEVNITSDLLVLQNHLKRLIDSFPDKGFRRDYWLSPYPEVILYTLLRTLRPRTVVETGVSGGISSSYMLQALKDNGCGMLYSIDLPSSRYRYRYKSGWMVPEHLRNRWSLIIGDSKKELKPLLINLREIDAFFHDSLHTYEHMLWEYKTVWPFIRWGGLLISDDIQSNRAFHHFSKIINRKTYSYRKGPFTYLGVIRKS